MMLLFVVLFEFNVICIYTGPLFYAFMNNVNSVCYFAYEIYQICSAKLFELLSFFADGNTNSQSNPKACIESNFHWIKNKK